MSSRESSISLPAYDSVQFRPKSAVLWLLICGLFVFVYWKVFQDLYANWTFIDSYYSHGFLVPLISLYFVWAKRDRLKETPIRPNVIGYVVVVGAAFMMLAGDFLGFRILGQLSVLPMVAGIILTVFGWRILRHVWFSVAFLVFMIPIPPSLTQGIVVTVKLFATDGAVMLARTLTLPMIRNGSFVVFGDDQLLVGEVCGGLRSLIALLAFGALMAYISRTRLWAKFFVLAIAGPVAVISNIARIFVLCVIGYFYGSQAVVGTVHDVSGILIFVVAFALMFTVEGILRKVAPAKEAKRS